MEGGGPLRLKSVARASPPSRKVARPLSNPQRAAACPVPPGVGLAFRNDSSGDERERIFIELMTSDRKLGVQRGLEMEDLRDLKDLTIHDVEPISDE